jgi:hypothetical protein
MAPSTAAVKTDAAERLLRVFVKMVCRSSPARAAGGAITFAPD